MSTIVINQRFFCFYIGTYNGKVFYLKSDYYVSPYCSILYLKEIRFKKKIQRDKKEDQRKNINHFYKNEFHPWILTICLLLSAKYRALISFTATLSLSLIQSSQTCIGILLSIISW